MNRGQEPGGLNFINYLHHFDLRGETNSRISACQKKVTQRT
jgi:hypothetical protein